MYDIAMTVAACLQAGTRADVAWLIDSQGLPVSDRSAAIVFTPGGGKIGSLGSTLDGKLADLAGRAPKGRLVEIEVSEVDALIAELPSAGSATCLLVPADTMPEKTWDLAAARVPFCLDIGLTGAEVDSSRVYSEETVAEADEQVQAIFSDAVSQSKLLEERAVSMFSAVPKMVIVGSGPVAEAIARLVGFLGWEARLETDASTASGLITPLSARDMVVVAEHDLELAGVALRAALESDCGYLGSVGSRKMQSDRADWLAYRGVTDHDRIHGPAGLDIGADGPEEIAVSVVAEAIEARSGGRP